MTMDDTKSSTCDVVVSGTTFQVPRDFYAYLNKALPWTDENNARNVNDDGPMTLDADPKAFRSLLHYVKHESLPHSFWKDEENVQALGSLAVVLGMPDLVLYVSKHTTPKDGFLKTNMKRSSSWQKRARAESKRKLESLTSPTKSILRKMRSPSYKNLVKQSHHVL